MKEEEMEGKETEPFLDCVFFLFFFTRSVFLFTFISLTAYNTLPCIYRSQ